MKSTDPEKQFVELLKAHGWNEAVRIFKEERAAAMATAGRDSNMTRFSISSIARTFDTWKT